MPADLSAFLRFTPDLLSAFVPSNDMVNSPSPRTWANAARLLVTRNLPRQYAEYCIGRCRGMPPPLPEQLQAFRDLIATMPSVDAILLPEPADRPDPDVIIHAYMPVSCALAYRATKGNFDRAAAVPHAPDDGPRGSLPRTALKTLFDASPDITQTNTYVRLIVGDFGQLVSGGSR